MAAQAVSCFLSQTYPEKELVILDDADELSFPEPLVHPLIRYFRTDVHFWLSIPQKRNQVCALAQGEIICHMDSDDWYDPRHMAEQVERIQATGLAVAGYHDLIFHNLTDDKFYEYRSGPYYALGATLAFRRSWWQEHPFDERKRTGSDTAFVRDARIASQLAAVKPEGRCIARVHAGNTASKEVAAKEWHPVGLEAVPEAYSAVEVLA